MLISDALLLSAGLGRRYTRSSDGLESSATPKQFQFLGKFPVLIHALKSLLSIEGIRRTVVVCSSEYFSLTETFLDKYLTFSEQTATSIILGGQERQDSSRLGLEDLAQKLPLPNRVVIHDASRPFISASLKSRVHRAILDRSSAAWIPAVPVVDTLKRVEARRVVETIDRNEVFRVQTPQVFEFSLIHSLAKQSRERMPEKRFTDDAALCEFHGIPVGIFEGDVRNIKLTYPFEMEMLRAVFRADLGRSEERNCERELDTTYTD